MLGLMDNESESNISHVNKNVIMNSNDDIKVLYILFLFNAGCVV